MQAHIMGRTQCRCVFTHLCRHCAYTWSGIIRRHDTRDPGSRYDHMRLHYAGPHIKARNRRWNSFGLLGWCSILTTGKLAFFVTFWNHGHFQTKSPQKQRQRIKSRQYLAISHSNQVQNGRPLLGQYFSSFSGFNSANQYLTIELTKNRSQNRGPIQGYVT